MLDKALAVISLASLVAFVGILITYIGHIDLIIVTVVVLIMAAYDFLLLNQAPPKSDEPAGPDTRP